MSMANDFLSGYIEEVQAYVPTLEKGVADLRVSPDRRDVLEEVYRLVHIIKGASSMVGVGGLSKIAGVMEGRLERILEGDLHFTPQTIEAMGSTVRRIGLFCQALSNGSSIDEAKLISETEAAFAGIDEVAEPESVGRPVQAAVVVDRPSEEEVSLEEELLAEFRGEADEHLEALHQELQRLESAVGGLVPLTTEMREDIRRIRRSVHTIKGASAVIGLADIAAYGHRVEDVLDWVYEEAGSLRPDLILGLSESIDQLALLVETPDRFDSERADAILLRLQTCMLDPELGGGSPPPEEDAIDEIGGAMAAEPPDAGESTGGGSLSSDLFSEEDRQILFAGFQEEADEHLQQIHHSIQSLESSVTRTTAITDQYREEVRRIRRAVHTIKGASAVIGLSAISGYAHGVEDFLDWLFEDAKTCDPDMINRLAEALDVLGQLVENPSSVDRKRQEKIQAELMVFAGTVESGAEVADSPAPQKAQPAAPKPGRQPAAQPEESEEDLTTAATQEGVKTLRVSQNQVDTLVNLANELLVGISGFDRDMEQFQEALSELELATSRIKDIALELETTFEVKALKDLGQRFNRVEKAIADLKGQEQFSEFDAMELDRYSQLNLIIRSLNESAIDVSAIHGNLGTIHSAIGGDINRQRRVVRELQLQLLRARMSPMSSITSRLSRTMRDVASRLGKRVRLQVEGDGVELDRVVWEKLADPFMHLVRNAIHHGIESDEARTAAGKPPIATITLSGRREGNSIVIRFRDDGQGLDFDAIRAKARKLGLGDQVDSMDRRQLTELIFYPGFSTKTISEISGRGVGMDVVRENLKELQGSIAVETAAGAGTTFVMRIPLTLGVVRCLLMQSGEVVYGIPLNDIREIQRLDAGSIDREAGIVRQGGKERPWHSLELLLGRGETSEDQERPLALVMAGEGQEVVVTIPVISGQNELVVKGLGGHLRSVAGVSGAAVLGDGSIVPVLNVGELIQTAEMGDQARQIKAKLEEPKIFTVMIVDDSISIRRVMSRLVTAQGWHPVEARDGMDALEQLDAVDPDCIILDVEMPRMNGFEFLMKLGNLPGGSEVPVIMLTSRTSAKHREKAFSLGAKGFLNKPCRDEDFVETVQLVTGGAVGAATGIVAEDAR